MCKYLYLLFVFLVLFSCNSSNKQNTENQESTTKNNSLSSEFNYAVVWNWTTKDNDLLTQNLPIFTKELRSLWERGIIENVYLDNGPREHNTPPFPSISFFLKSNDINNTTSILDSLSFVKNGVASYKLYPVGLLWLGQNTNSSKKHKTFVTIWETKNIRPVDKLTKTQNDSIIALWNKGLIENIYFDVEGVLDSNKKTDFVFYVKASNLNDANAICNSLPFSIEKVASFKIVSAGTLWLGVNNNHKINMQ